MANLANPNLRLWDTGVRVLNGQDNATVNNSFNILQAHNLDVNEPTWHNPTLMEIAR